MSKAASAKTVVVNKKARFNFFLEETYEAGIVLTGPEVKSIRMSKVNIDSAYVMYTKGELYLVGSHISACQYATNFRQEPDRKRKLLLKHEEIRRIIGKIKKPGYSLIPCALYFSDKGWAKLEIAIARGKKLHDKRQDIKRREWQREQASILKSNRR